MNNVLYQVEYLSVDTGQWTVCRNSTFSRYNEAIAKLGEHLASDPIVSHRIMQVETVVNLMAIVEAEGL
jgi:hypothetical protein